MKTNKIYQKIHFLTIGDSIVFTRNAYAFLEWICHLASVSID